MITHIDRKQVNRGLLVLLIALGGLIFFNRRAVRAVIFPPERVQGEIIFHSDPDGDGVFQLYHLAFDTDHDNMRADQLTGLPTGAQSGRYSPDGSAIVFESDHMLYLMDADGRNPRQLVEGFDAWWLDDTQIVFQRRIGTFWTEYNVTCSVSTLFLFDLTTNEETPLFELEGAFRYADELTVLEDGSIEINYRPRNVPCQWENLYQFYRIIEEVLCKPGVFLVPDDFRWATCPILAGEYVLSPFRRSLADVVIAPYSDAFSGIKVHTPGVDQAYWWQLVISVHGGHVSWSPDERYLVYDALHPDGTWVIALTSVDGRHTFPLIGNDGISRFEPDWRS